MLCPQVAVNLLPEVRDSVGFSHFLAFIPSFGKFWWAWQKSLRDTADALSRRSDAVANAIGYATRSATPTRRRPTRSDMDFISLHPAQKIPLRPCNTLRVFAPLVFGRNLEQIPNHLVSGALEPMQITGRQTLVKT